MQIKFASEGSQCIVPWFIYFFLPSCKGFVRHTQTVYAYFPTTWWCPIALYRGLKDIKGITFLGSFSNSNRWSSVFLALRYMRYTDVNSWCFVTKRTRKGRPIWSLQSPNKTVLRKDSQQKQIHVMWFVQVQLKNRPTLVILHT